MFELYFEAVTDVSPPIRLIASKQKVQERKELKFLTTYKKSNITIHLYANCLKEQFETEIDRSSDLFTEP
jgi:hypothetical protein